MDYLLANNSGCSGGGGGGGGCESGWTLYLDNSFVSPSYYNNNGFSEEKGIILKNGAVEEEEEEEEEDLSMVSDASSGPPQYFAEEEESNCCIYNYNAPLVDTTTAAVFCKNGGKSIKKVKENRVHDHHQPSSLLDDTASSPVFDISDVSLFFFCLKFCSQFSFKCYFISHI